MMISPLENYRVTQTYSKDHQGYDLAAPYGSPVRSPVDGVVTDVGLNPQYKGGLYVTVKDRFGQEHYTGHHSKIHVKRGQSVQEGQHIADLGNTGQVVPMPTKENPTAGTHTHYQIRKGDKLLRLEEAEKETEDNMDWKSFALKAEALADDRKNALDVKDREIADLRADNKRLFDMCEDRLRVIKAYEKQVAEGGDIKAQVSEILTLLKEKK